MPDTEPLHRFVPPHWPVATGEPSFLDLCRSPANILLGWSKAVYDGGCYQAKLPGAVLIIGDVEMAAEILFDRAEDFPHGELADRLFRPVWGRGIFVSEGAEWKWQRRAAMPAFRADRMKGFAPTMAAAADRTIAEWRATNAPVNLHDEMRQLTLRVLIDAALSGGEGFPGIDEISTHIASIMSNLGRIGLGDVLPIPYSMRPSTEKRAGASTVWIRLEVAAMVARRRNQPPRRDLVDLLMESVDPETGQRMDDDLVRDNLVGFIAAGHETSSYALSWALWLVSQHEPTRTRMLEEIATVAGDAPLGAEHLDGLVFTRRVLQETMRLFPGATALFRTAAKDVEIKGRRIKRGTGCVIASHAFHRNPAFWPDPHAFDPDRFAPDRATGPRPRLAWMAFGGGPRVCMGAAFAMTELVIVLASLVRAMHLESDPGRPVRVATRLNAFVSEGGMWMKPVARPT